MSELAIIEGPEVVEAEIVQVVETVDNRRSPAWVYLQSLTSLQSKRAMEKALQIVAQILNNGQPCDIYSAPWGKVRNEDVVEVKAALIEMYSGKSSTVNQRLAALRGVLKTAWQNGHMSSEDYAKVAAVKGMKRTVNVAAAGRALHPGEVQALFTACNDGTNLGSRDAAMFAMLFGAGLRRSEAISFELKDYDAQTGEIMVLSGKGGKDRNGYATNGTKAAIEAWIAKRGDWEGPLLAPVLKGGRILQRGITDQAIWYALEQRINMAAIREKTSPHDLRRSFITYLIDAGVDLSTVQKLAGHADIKTTVGYDRRGEEAKQKAVHSLHVPFVG